MKSKTRRGEREVILGVTGSIAAYKAAEITRRLRKAGAGVTCVMTAGATRFITPITLQALTGRKVLTSLFEEQPGEAWDMEHLELTEKADAILVAPASANFIARFAAGMADDALTATCLAAACPVWLAPAMNARMWTHPATRDNVTTLKRRGVKFIGPVEGSQAEMQSGPGRLAEPEKIVAQVLAARRS